MTMNLQLARKTASGVGLFYALFFLFLPEGANSQDALERQVSARCQAVVNELVQRPADADFATVAARLAAGEKLPDACHMLSALLRHPEHNLRFDFSLIATYLHGQKNLPDSLRALIRRHYAVNPLLRGRSEVEWQLYYSTILLAAQAWPEATAAEWFNGKSSEANQREASEYVYQWMQQVAAQGQREFDSPQYLPVFLSTLLLIHDFAEDAQLRQLATIVLDLLFADFAVEHLDGQYVGAHSCSPAPGNLTPAESPVADLAWLLFGAGEKQIDEASLWLALSRYAVPEVVLGLGLQRQERYVHRERKPAATLYRATLGGPSDGSVQKYTYMTRDYALGSLTGAPADLEGQRTWAVNYSDAGDRHPLFFVTHPYAGDAWLGMYYPDPPRVLPKVLGVREPDFVNPQKLHGASPYEKVFQHRNVLIALYDIPPGAAHPWINGFLSRDITIRDRDANGWIFCQAGRVFLGIRFLRPVEWQQIAPGWRLVSLGHRNAVIVEASGFEDYPSFEEFKQRLTATTLKAELNSAETVLTYTNPFGEVFDVATSGEQITGIAKLTYTTAYGDEFEIFSSGVSKMNGVPLYTGRWPLFDSQLMKADERRHLVLLRHDKRWRQLDFVNWESRDIDASFGKELTRER